MAQFSRREFLITTAGAALAPAAAAQELSGFYYRSYSRCVPDYLSSLVRAAYERRTSQLKSLGDAAAVRMRQAWARETLWKLVGGPLERTPLEPHITGEFERPGYRLRKLVYQSQPGVFVSANVYVPSSGGKPFPGVLFQMGHGDSGKSYASYQKCCQGLARLGYVVLAFDPIGQGERIEYPDATGIHTRLDSSDDEHDMFGKQLLLLGDTSSRQQVWDAIRGLDYLALHPMVDPTRLAATGQSGGGTLTMLLACLDDRLTTAAVSSGNTENFACAHFDPPGSTDDAEQDLIGSGALAFDRWDLLYPFAPKPLLIQVSSHDFFGTYSPNYLDDGREEYGRLKHAYTLLGHPDHLSWNSTPLTHGLTYSLRLEIYNWFERWLKHSDAPVEKEPPVAPEPDKALWAGRTGNVFRDFGGLSQVSLLKRAASAKAAVPAGSDWKSAVGFSLPDANLRMQKLAEVSLGDVLLSAAEVESTGKVWIPAWWFVPVGGDSGRPPLIVLDDRGRNGNSKEDGLHHELARAGRRVLAADVSLIGDSRAEVGRGNPAYTIPHDAEDEFAWAFLIMGKPLLGQRVSDILALVRAAQNESGSGNAPVSIAARGRLTVPALFAFALCDQVSSLYLAGGLISFQSILEKEVYDQPLANFAWNLRTLTDLPSLASESGERTIHLSGMLDAAQHPIPLSQVQQLYRGTNVKVSADAMWDKKSLVSM